jgi:uncharacterized membrane protein HdeD (DUF308 family)
MDASTTLARQLSTRGLLAGLIGLATIALPEAVAGAAGLTLLYAVAGLSILSGTVNFLNAVRVRELASWLLPVSLLVTGFGFLLLASPVALGVALTRVIGVAIILGGGFTVMRAIRQERADRADGSALPAAR